jgi:Cu+-exporting ATPase
MATKLDTIVLDKTGTITIGKPAVTDIIPIEPEFKTTEDLLKLGASVEKGSEHPLGKAIVKHAESKALELSAPEEFKASGGLGVQGRIDGRMVTVGKPDWFKELKIPIESVPGKPALRLDCGIR